MKNLLFILGDELSRSLSSLTACSIEDTGVLMAEVQEEAAYAAHHKKKIAFVFSAMRHFMRELKADGWRNRQKLRRNQRLKQVYRAVDTMSDAKKADIRAKRSELP
jgi:deoxyribodipyrimidine photolyase-like uncharacterized protein